MEDLSSGAHGAKKPPIYQFVFQLDVIADVLHMV